jgi:hypothetical protein
MADAKEILRQAELEAARAESWADLSNFLFDPISGIVAGAYPIRAEPAAFIKTEEYRQIRKLVHDAMDRFGLVEGATPRRFAQWDTNALRDKIATGLEELDRGESIPGDIVFEELRRLSLRRRQKE